MEGTIGEIRMFAGTFSPRTWSFCNGQLISIATNTALFSILGTTYGGNGQTNFALPDFQGRVAVGTGTGPGLPNVQLGEKAGTPTITLTSANMPAHTHALTGSVSLNGVNDSGGLNTDPTNRYLAAANIYTNLATDVVAMNPGSITNTLQVGISGNGQPFGITPPYLGMNYIICMFGIFPSRD